MRPISGIPCLQQLSPYRCTTGQRRVADRLSDWTLVEKTQAEIDSVPARFHGGRPADFLDTLGTLTLPVIPSSRGLTHSPPQLLQWLLSSELMRYAKQVVMTPNRTKLCQPTGMHPYGTALPMVQARSIY